MAIKITVNKISQLSPVIYALLVIPYLGLFSNEFDFLLFDDEVNLVNNSRIKELTWENVYWMFTGNLLGVYEPISWLVKAITIEMFGFSPKSIHLTTLLFHIANAYLLFVCTAKILMAVHVKISADVIRQTAMVVSLIYAVHPLRVEVVAWASGQSYAIGAFCALISVYFYLAFCEKSEVDNKPYFWLFLSICFYVLAFLSKSAMVLLPIWIFLVDWFVYDRRDLKPLIVEKIPYVILMLLTVVVVSIVNDQAMGENHTILSWPDKIGRAVIATCLYPLMSVWPINLTASHALPLWGISIYQPAAISSLLCLLIFGVYAIRRFSVNPWLCVVFAAYVGALLPVLGFVQHGNPVLVADRYSYIATMPFYVGVAGLSLKLGAHKMYLRCAAVFLVFWLLVLSSQQAQYWKSDNRLWHYALKVQPYNVFAANNLGFGYWLAKDYDRAQLYLERAYSFEPSNSRVLINLGVTYYELDRCDKAVELYTEAAKGVHAAVANLYNNLGNCYIKLKQYRKSLPQFQKALELKPNHEKAKKSLKKVSDYLTDVSRNPR